MLVTRNRGDALRSIADELQADCIRDLRECRLVEDVADVLRLILSKKSHLKWTAVAYGVGRPANARIPCMQLIIISQVLDSLGIQGCEFFDPIVDDVSVPHAVEVLYSLVAARPWRYFPLWNARRQCE